MACVKHCPFPILFEKYRMSSCTTCQMRSSDISMSLTMNLIDVLKLWSIMVRISSKNSGVLYLDKPSELSTLPYLCNHNWTLPSLFESSTQYSDSHIFLLLIIMCYLHELPRISYVICFYQPLLPVGLLDIILCSYRAVVNKF